MIKLALSVWALQVNQWVVEQRLPEGEFLFDISNPDSSEAYRILDLA